jgi:coproporphyrinogen III oxidase-like Fe-S oxidoreductase
MFIEKFFTVCAERLTKRYLKFKDCSSPLPPKPDKNDPYMLYMHIPFCEELCPFCSFLRIKFERPLACSYFDALHREIELYRDAGYCFDSIYVGGGTPTIMPDRLAGTIEFVKSIWPIKKISVETNPNHLSPDILKILKDVGVNRLSVGVQSFNNGILENIKRRQKYGSGEEIKERLSSVVGMFDTLNVDMIFNFPGQTEDMLADDIEIIKEIKADQITYYPLMVSSSRKKEVTEACGPVSYKQERRLYEQLCEQLTQMYNQESIWCFSSKKGLTDEYVVDHDNYAGIGAGAMGYVNGTLYSNTFSVPHYIDIMQKGKFPIIKNKSFSSHGKMRYHFMLKMLSGTVNISTMKKDYGKGFWFYLSGVLLFLYMNRSIIFKDDNIILTPRGRYFWVILMRSIFAVTGDYRETRARLDALAVGALGASR